MQKMSNAEIVAIGTEILLGDLVDTNSAWLSQHLAALGVNVYRHTAIGDNRERIVAALGEAAARSDLVVTTGGLGPTSDDLTHECLSLLTGRPLVEYPEARRHVDEMFRRFGRKPTPSNYKQALFPEGARLIPNPLGTAMGALLEHEGTLFATFPGVPGEMRTMFEETLAPLIRERNEGTIVSRTLWFAGIGESALAERVQDLLDAPDPTVAPLAGEGKVRLRITTRAATPEEAIEKIRPVEREILARLGRYYFGQDDETLEGAVGRLLRERGETLAVAESCTGGLLAKRLTDVPGSSEYFREGIIAYSNEAKERLLMVPREVLAEHGAVSEPVALGMAEGVRKLSGADYGLSVTGIAGPGGGTEEKPVGLVWVGIADRRGSRAHRLDLSAWARSRSAIRERSASMAFDLLRRALQKVKEA
ncbi:Putative competence-damage inducible protein [Rubrobacter xylanophilus DSM 9941]|uniref:competence/damage-inducible protein A n=1 Tax=Rubrobacter xylanophilus TaxID=49319 RepID=UPI001C63E888|nr:competence/damage-inducible protein A [Rubrobacter xylanophilus]QYJ15526.1 Putative competence-damage inducible protein [Rubrobacter xylanophilus DSM 9941]